MGKEGTEIMRDEKRERIPDVLKEEERGQAPDVREKISLALLELLEEKEFHEIRITELTERAGVSRNSFYRNYESREQVLLEHMRALSEEWKERFEREQNPDFPLWFFELFDRIRPVVLLLYRRGLSTLFLEHLRWCCGARREQTNLEAYVRAVFAGSFFGWIDEWIRRGMQETPEEMIRMMRQWNGMTMIW